jgi:polar amino acid transport system substrate-binding protein
MRRNTFLRLGAAAVALVAAAALSACGSGSADNALGTRESGVIRVGSLGDAKPYTYTANGTFTGFDVELLKDIARRMGVRAEFAGQDFSGLLAAVKNGQYDVGAAAIGITDARRQTVDFSEGYLTGYLTVLTRRDSGVTSAKALGGKRLAVVQGTIQETYAAKHFTSATLVRFPDNNSAVSALNSTTVDAHFLDIAAAQDYTKQYPGLVTVADIPSMDAPAGFAVRKGNKALLDALNKGLHEAIADGTWLRLYKKFFPNLPVPQQYTPQGATATTAP